MLFSGSVRVKLIAGLLQDGLSQPVGRRPMDGDRV